MAKSLFMLSWNTAGLASVQLSLFQDHVELRFAKAEPLVKFPSQDRQFLRVVSVDSCALLRQKDVLLAFRRGAAKGHG